MLAALLLAAAASAAVPRLALPAAPLFAPHLTLPAARLPAAALAPALPLPAPALAPSLLAPAPVAASDAPTPSEGVARGAAALAARAAEFERLVGELMGEDAEKSAAAAVALRELKDRHLNPEPHPKKTPVLSLKPMQIPAGMISVKDKAEKLRGLKHKELDETLREHSAPVIEDYKGRRRPVDRHHETRGAWEAGVEEVYSHHYLDDELHARLKALPRERFYAVTRAMGLFYDRDQYGNGPHDPDHLPETVRSLADDPFRSVAWRVRRLGGFEKSSVPFAEFAWANFFRARVKTYPTEADFDEAVREALAIAHSQEAKDLPGWTPR